MANNYIDNGDGTYTIEKPITCCQNGVTKTGLQLEIDAITANIATLPTRKAELEADLIAINAL
jgi:hypothetical protein